MIYKPKVFGCFTIVEEVLPYSAKELNHSALKNSWLVAYKNRQILFTSNLEVTEHSKLITQNQNYRTFAQNI
ncbi:MAG: hypothetical protein ACI848_000033 [Roseivirga sp.]|jgi:hypothetical protein